MSIVRGSLFAAKPQTLLRSSGGSLRKMANIFSVAAIGELWAKVVRCERYVRSNVVEE